MLTAWVCSSSCLAVPPEEAYHLMFLLSIVDDTQTLSCSVFHVFYQWCSSIAPPFLSWCLLRIWQTLGNLIMLLILDALKRMLGIHDICLFSSSCMRWIQEELGKNPTWQIRTRDFWTHPSFIDRVTAKFLESILLIQLQFSSILDYF